MTFDYIKEIYSTNVMKISLSSLSAGFFAYLLAFYDKSNTFLYLAGILISVGCLCLLKYCYDLKTNLVKRINDIERNHRNYKSELTEIADQITTNASRFQPFQRTLTKEVAANLSNIWGERLGIALNESAVTYYAHRICISESMCAGRAATPIEAATLRTIVASSIKSPDLRILEIGTLFGVWVGATYEVCQNQYNSVHLTVIDPFDGYYGANNLDIVTGAKISESTFLNNMKRLDVPDSDYTIVKEYSNSKIAQTAAGKARYNFLLIDGDHSGEGVKSDFDLYHDLVESGGYIIFDDYDSQYWPEIKPVVDRYVLSRNDLEFIGAEFNTAVFRVL